MSDYLDDFVPCLHEILRDNSMDRRIKLPALHALGDLCMYSGDQFSQKYFESTITIFDQASRMSVQVQNHNDETLEFLSELRETILDQYIIILISLQDTNSEDKFIAHLQNVFDFMQTTVTIEGRKSPRVLKVVLGLIGDIASTFPSNAGVKAKCTESWVEQCILYLQSLPEAEFKDQASYTLNAIKKSMAS